MNSNHIDLTNCDREPIHIPGRVQSHGFLIAADSQSLLISYASSNINSFFPAAADSILGLPLADFEKISGMAENGVALLPLLKLGEVKQSYETINPYPVQIGGKDYYLIISLSASLYVLEFEPVTLQYDIQNQIGKSVSDILSGKSIHTLLQNTAKEIKNLIAYDRVMIYRFLEDGHGEVIAEARNEDLEPFFGLHYPASDIPKQARELYKLNYTRIIADVNSESSAILTHETDATIDLTHSVLRAVSPVHIQYLKNMGVDSSFSVSLIVQGELWGLVACHNYTPKFIDYKAREAAKLIGKIVSSALEYKQDEELDELNKSHQLAITQLSLHLNKDEELIPVLTRQEHTIKDIVNASGSAVFMDGKIVTMGETPDDEQLRELFSWLKKTMDDTIYYTHSLPEVFHPARAYKSIGSGLIAIMISKEMDEMIIWFKPEQMATINWAGNPEKPVMLSENGLMNLSPRNSFEIFSEIVENTSLKWSRTEVNNVKKIREAILNAITKKAGEIRLLNDRLKQAYDELDTFSYTISHDLRTPLTSIKSYTELVILSNKSLDEQGKKLLGRVVAGADKMGFLINEILKLARVGRSELEYVTIDMQQMIADVATEVKASLYADHVKIVFGDLPAIKGAQPLILQVFTNMISNAVKYSAGSAAPEVFIGGTIEHDEILYKIADNGIGIEVDHHSKVYELFKRMNNVKDIEGTGVGLAIVKRILEKHNARIWFESELKVGTVFYIAFKK